MGNNSYVIFSNSYGEKRKIGKPIKNKKDAIHEINDFLNDHSFKSYYFRSWFSKETNMYVIDVGSHTEFFYVDKDIWEK